MSKLSRLREDIALANALREKMEQWLIMTNPKIVKQFTKSQVKTTLPQHNKLTR